MIRMEEEDLAFIYELPDEDEVEDADKIDKYLRGLIKEIGRDAPGLESLHIELVSEQLDESYSTYAAVRNNGEFSVEVFAWRDELLMDRFLSNLVDAKLFDPTTP